MVAFEVASMSSGPRQLTSWKEIAHHLGVNVRTAQKWERDHAMPVHRVSGARGRVSADIGTLDTWRQQLVDAPKNEDHCYCWPLGHGLTVGVRFRGTAVGPTHIDLLREYLDLFKTALR